MMTDASKILIKTHKFVDIEPIIWYNYRKSYKKCGVILKNVDYPLYKVENIKTLKDLITLSEGKYAKNKAFWFADRKAVITEITYADFARDTKKLSSYLQSIGCKGNNIAVYGENSYEWILSYFAAVCSANVIVPIDKELGGTEAGALIKRAECKVVFYSENYSDEIKEADLPAEIKTVCMSEFSDLPFEEFGDTEINPDDLAAIVYTSGTTGISKGVMLTHGNLARDAADSCSNLFVPNGTILLLPLHHTFGMMAGVLCQLLLGYPVFINQSLKYLKRDIEIAKPRHLSVVPLIIEVLYKNIWESAKKQNKDKALRTLVKFSNILLKLGIDLRKKLFKSVIDGLGGNLEMLISGGAAISSELIDGIGAFGIKMINGYGITECSPIVATTRNKHENFPSVGCVVPECEVKITDKDENGIGEIYIKGAIVTKGYFKDDVETSRAFDGDWFKTGDLGYFDEQNFLYITGRKKNLIILPNGKNVSPEELEALIVLIENVDEVIVFEENGFITAEIYAENRSGIEDKITELNKTLPLYKQIAKVKFRNEEFEKTTTKKIKRQNH